MSDAPVSVACMVVCTNTPGGGGAGRTRLCFYCMVVACKGKALVYQIDDDEEEVVVLVEEEEHDHCIYTRTSRDWW